MKNLKILLFLFSISMMANKTYAGDKYEKHNEIQYSKYYEKTDSVNFGQADLISCDNSNIVNKKLFLTSNPACVDASEEYYAELYLDFRIGDDHYNFGKNYKTLLNYTISCLVDVTVFDGPIHTYILQNQPLTINYNPVTNKLFNPQEIKKIIIEDDLSGKDGFEVRLVPNSISVTGSTTVFTSIDNNIQQQIQLEAFYKLNRKYDASLISSPKVEINNSLLIQNNQYKYIDNTGDLDFRMVKLKWDVVGCTDFEFEKYQVQILKLSNTDSDEDIYKDNLFDVNTYVDWNDAISIEVGGSKKFIDIYLTQGKGIYTWRVRPIGNIHEGGIANSQNWGKWNQASIINGTQIIYDYDDVSSQPTFFRMYIDANTNDDLNWVHSRVFNESDESATKFYDEITYSDDLLGKRQYQKKVNSTDNNLTAEYYPDYHGNSVLSSLFAPIYSINGWQDNYNDVSNTPHSPDHGSDLLYKNYTLKETINNDLDDNSAKFSFINFGKDKVADPVDGGDIFKYYDDSGEPGVPSSEGYPYTRSIYYNDGTNRLKEQRLPGLVSNTNTDNLGKIRTFYATATEQELVSLFGKEAPNPQKVFKVINIDQNNVYHYTYKGVDGKVIATAYRNQATDELLAINNTSGHSYVITEEEHLITDYFPIKNENLLSYKEEKDIFVRDGSASQVIYTLRNTPFEVENVCNFDVNNNLTQGTETPDIGVDIKIITSNNDDYTGTPNVINLSTSTGSLESTDNTLTNPFALTSTEPATYKLSRTVSINKDDIDTKVEEYKGNIKLILENQTFNEEINYLVNIINGNPFTSIEQFRLNLVPNENNNDTPPNLNWNWTDSEGNVVIENAPTSDGNYTKFIPSVGSGCDTYSVKIPRNICNSSDVCYLEPDSYGNDNYEQLIIQNFASREIYSSASENSPLKLNLIEDYFWEPTSIDIQNTLIRLIPTTGPKFDTDANSNEGAFNKMIANMLAEVYENDHYIKASLGQNDSVGKPIWTKEEICDCWNTAIDKFQTIGFITDEASGKEILNPEFSLMDAFLSCTGTMFKGYSNTPFEENDYCLDRQTNNLLDGNSGKLCYYDDNGVPALGDDARNPENLIIGNGYFENAYKYLPYSIKSYDQDFVNSVFEIEKEAETIVGSCDCDPTLTEDYYDEYTINLNPEYDNYAGLIVDDPKNLDFYYQYAGINNKKTIANMHDDADFTLPELPFFRNEYKRIYDQWHGRTTLINFISAEGDTKRGASKKEELPDDLNPCDPNSKANKSKTDVLNNFNNLPSLGIDLPPCMDCANAQPCGADDLRFMLAQYVSECMETCDKERFIVGVTEMFHNNKDKYYVVEGDAIRDFDFGTYEIISSTEMQLVGTSNIELMSTYNVEYITNDRISKYAATLVGNCETDCQPMCFEPTITKYADNSGNSGRTTRTNPYTREQEVIKSKDKPIKQNNELEYNTECMLEDITRIFKVMSSSYELQLPAIDCEGNPSYCEVEEKTDWKTLRVGDYYLDSEGKLHSISNDEDLYKAELVGSLNSGLITIKMFNRSYVNFDDIKNGTYLLSLPERVKADINNMNWHNSLMEKVLYYTKYRPLLYGNYESRNYAYGILKSIVNQFDQDLDYRYKWHHGCTISIDCIQYKHYHDGDYILNNNENIINGGELVNYTLHDREEKYNKKQFNYHYVENNFLNLPDIFYNENVLNSRFERDFFNNFSIEAYREVGNDFSKPTSIESLSSFTFPPNFFPIIIYKKDKHNVKNTKGQYDVVTLFDYFTIEGDYIEINREIYNFNNATRDEFWDTNNKLKINITNVDGTNYEQYELIKDYWFPNPEQLTRIIKDDGEKIIHIKGQFLKLPEFEEPDTTESFCFRWIPPGEDEFDQPFEHELIVNDCEFNEPDMYLDMIKTQIDDIAYKLGEEYRKKIMDGIQEYVFGAENTETDDLDELKVILPAENTTKFTLYYYDHHGNLVKTVPPKGVNVDLNRDRDDLAVHDMETMYQYNSTGQLVASKSADQSTDNSVMIGSVPCEYDGETVYIYDLAGRLRFTVNSNQMEGKKRNELNYPLATYYKYDKRGRLIETGEMHTYFANYDLLTTPEYFTVGDYLRWYLDMKKLERTNPTDKETARKFYKYQRQFSEKLLENLDFPSDKDPAGNFVYTGFINPLYNSGSLSALNYLYRPIKLKIITTYDSPQSLPFATDYRIDGVAPTQKYLRNRISNITRIPDSEWEDGSFFPNRVDSYYSYDPHGNVDWYYQYIQPHKTNAVQYGMLTHYEYDLISGNVTQIHYQPGKVDEFTQIYDYDADNRLTEVNTTRFGILKETDARYKYYKHGPLKRKEYGSDYVQGMDYYYTIQGWLKGINDVNMNDYNGWDKLGGDALTTANRKYAYDAFAMSLNYFDGDFAVNTTTSPTPGTDYIHKVGTLHKELYNGNISSWEQVHNIKYNPPVPPGQQIVDPDMIARINEFEYDISGRLITSEILKTTSTGTTPLTVAPERYSSGYDYDLNGNIEDISRYDDNMSSANLTTQSSSFSSYTDNSSRVRPMNRLTQVTNSSSGIPKDYNYDNMGNIISKIDFTNPPSNPDFHIVWTADGKIDTVIKFITVPNKANHSIPEIYVIKTSYYYDGMGNKVMTITEPEAAMEYPISLRCNGDEDMLSLYSNCVECIEALGLKSTYYGREAGGKTLALYDTDPPINDANGIYSCQVDYTEIWLDDWYVYGSEADGRIATVDPKEVIEGSGKRMNGSEFLLPVNMVGSPIDTLKVPIAMRGRGINGVTGTYQVQQRVPDFRRYEIKDHLGNVRTVVADYKNPDPTYTSGSMNFWKYFADVKNISNMYPYGKSYGTNAIYNAAGDYRYGFNGMEKEKNMDASGDITDFGARVYDANFPVFLSPDPMEPKFGYQSTYVFAGNTPIQAIDLNGERIFIINNQRMTVAALDAANATEIGHKILSEFAGNDKHLIIFTGDIKKSASNDETWQADAYTYSNLFKDQFIKDGEINLEKIKDVYPDVYEEFSALIGIKLEDLGIKEEDKISLIKLGNYTPTVQGDVKLFFDNGNLNIEILKVISEIAGIHETNHALYASEDNEDHNPAEDHERMGSETGFIQGFINFLIQLGEHRNKDTDIYKFEQQFENLDSKILEDIIKKFNDSFNTTDYKEYKPVK